MESPQERTTQILNGRSKDGRFVSKNSKLVDAAAEILGAPVEAGVWLDRYPSRWYHNLSSGTELDLVFVVLAMPYLLWQKIARPTSDLEAETGPVFCVITESQLVFFSATEGFFKPGLKDEYDRRDVRDVLSCVYNVRNDKDLHIKFSDSTEVLLYYCGPHLDVERFVSLLS